MTNRRIRKMSEKDAWEDFRKSVSKSKSPSRPSIRKGGNDMKRIKKEAPGEGSAMTARIDQNLQKIVDALPMIEAMYNMLNTQEDVVEDEMMEEEIPIEPMFDEEEPLEEDIELSYDDEEPDEDIIEKPEDEEIEKTEEDDFDGSGTDEVPDDEVEIDDPVEDDMVEKTEEDDFDGTGTDEVPEDAVKINTPTVDVTLKKSKKGKIVKTERPKGIQKAQDARKNDVVSTKEYLSRIGRTDPKAFTAPLRRR